MKKYLKSLSIFASLLIANTITVFADVIAEPIPEEGEEALSLLPIATGLVVVVILITVFLIRKNKRGK